jgi:membrane protease YdiL (CAAX protease family)
MANWKILKDWLKEGMTPLAASFRAVGLTVFALVATLVHLSLGSGRFFIQQLGPSLLPDASAGVLEYAGVIYQFAVTCLLFLLVPLVALKLFARQGLAELGLALGDKFAGFCVVVPLGFLVFGLSAFSVSFDPVFQSEYPMAKLAASSWSYFLVYQVAYGLLYYVAYEAFFRGMLQFSLRRELGATAAILIQTCITTLLHIGKPEPEIWSALLAGLAFGLLAFRLRSIWPLVILHWGLGLMTDIFCAQASGIWLIGRF